MLMIIVVKVHLKIFKFGVIVFIFLKYNLDLRIKSEPVAISNSGEFPQNIHPTAEWKNTDNSTKPTSPTNRSWKLDTSHKNVVSTLTPDGNCIFFFIYA